MVWEQRFTGGRIWSSRRPTVEFLVHGIHDDVPAVGSTDTALSTKVTRSIGANLADFAWWYLKNHTTVLERRISYDSYKKAYNLCATAITPPADAPDRYKPTYPRAETNGIFESTDDVLSIFCLLYTSPSPRD